MNATTYTGIRDEIRNGWYGARGFNAVTIAAMLAGFVLFWPIGLAILVRNIWREKQYRRSGGLTQRYAERQGFGFATSGNSAFDDYKRQRLDELEAERRRLWEEEREFSRFMDELRRAKDREEFDRFMNERRNRDVQA